MTPTVCKHDSQIIALTKVWCNLSIQSIASTFTLIVGVILVSGCLTRLDIFICGVRSVSPVDLWAVTSVLNVIVRSHVEQVTEAEGWGVRQAFEVMAVISFGYNLLYDVYTVFPRKSARGAN